MSSMQITTLVALSLALMLAMGNVGSKQGSSGSKAKMALIWVIVIAGLTVIINQFI